MAACKLGAVLAGPLTEADARLLIGWTETGQDTKGRTISAEVLARAITAGTDTPVGPTTLKDHRAGRCACHRGKATP